MAIAALHYQSLHAARAGLLRRAGDRAGATAAYHQVIELRANAVERAEPERRLVALLPPRRSHVHDSFHVGAPPSNTVGTMWLYDPREATPLLDS